MPIVRCRHNKVVGILEKVTTKLIVLTTSSIPCDVDASDTYVLPLCCIMVKSVQEKVPYIKLSIRASATNIVRSNTKRAGDRQLQNC